MGEFVIQFLLPLMVYVFLLGWKVGRLGKDSYLT